MTWGTAFFALLLLAVASLLLARRSRVSTGLPAGRLIYSDTTRWRPVEKPLFSQVHRLTGRPDYVMQQRRDSIPVEVKSGHAPPAGPYAAHILQLAAYCLLIEETFQRRPPYGIILYTDDADQSFAVDYTAALEDRLLSSIDDMREALAQGDAPRSHNQKARCYACGYRSGCEQSLA
jgi:CRISPR-associated exonuclease Cas4